MQPSSSIKSLVELGLKWPKFMYENAANEGVDGIKDGLEFTEEIALKKLSRGVVNNVYNPGTPIWEDEWDVLLVLDACRVDLLKEVAGEYEFLPDEDSFGTRWSVASMSEDWLSRTFSSEYSQHVKQTGYVTGNAFTRKVDFEVQPALVDEVWTYAWDEEVNTIPARSLTDRAIDSWRNRRSNMDKMVVHYMQPHAPFIPDTSLGEYTRPEEFGEGFADIWRRIGDTVTLEEVWKAYRGNLCHVLDDVELLLDNLDADRVAITADHGNAVGECGFYGHPGDVLHPTIRKVPWIITSATDNHSYEPELQPPETAVDADVEDRLSQLGYR